MNAKLIVDAIITGILTGGVYALMASGLTLIFGVMDIINIAQGALVILGAYLSYALAQNFHIDLFLGLLITMPLMFLFGVLLETAFIRPLKRERTMFSILVTFAIALIIEGALGVIFSTTPIQLRAWYVDASFLVGGFYLADVYIFGFILSVVLLAGLYVLLYRTKCSFRGALIAAVTMLVIEDVTAVVWSPVWANTVFFILLVVILLVRPQGLFGQLQGRKQ